MPDADRIMLLNPFLEFGIPLILALILGFVAGVAVPGKRERQISRILLGMAGGFVGVVISFVVAVAVVQSPGAVNITIVAVCASLGAIAGAMTSR